jgi:LPXTG-motif cell wall-anchored protein
VNYDKTVIGTAPMAIQVFDSVARIKGLSGDMGIAQMESDGKILKVTEMYALNNTSAPPVTQSGPRNFEIFLPEKAVLDSVEAKREGGLWIKTAPAPVNDQAGHYAISFPLRPGDTLIKSIYHLPYTKATRFHLKLSYPIRRFAVVHPPSMIFKASRPGAFSSPGQTNGLQLEAVVKGPLLADVPAFEVSGVGMAPSPASTAATQAPPASPAPAVAAVPNAPVQQAAGSGATPSTGPTPESWIALLATAGLLTIGAIVMRWRRKTPPVATAPPVVVALRESYFSWKWTEHAARFRRKTTRRSSRA